jgi:hypothetical protein
MTVPLRRVLWMREQLKEIYPEEALNSFEALDANATAACNLASPWNSHFTVRNSMRNSSRGSMRNSMRNSSRDHATIPEESNGIEPEVHLVSAGAGDHADVAKVCV